jgi:hydrogenase/urease accessory protein HupE
MSGIGGLKAMISRLLRRIVLCFTLMGFVGPIVHAHELTMAEMTMREVAPGQFVWSWGASGKGGRPIAEDLTPKWPEGCVGDQQVIQCGPKGLAGPLSVTGVGKAYSAAIIRIYWRSGDRQVVTLTSAQPKVQLFGSAKDERAGSEVAAAYFSLGIEHILTGFDHLLFVISLLFLVGFRKRLIATITAFTLAHSVTLAASALGLLVLRSPPVEASIALSIVLVSAEALHRRETWTRQWPALVAFIFGLVHGLGFAGALQEIGLPEQHVSMALLTFNLGVEAGQLLVVALAWGLILMLARNPVLARMKAPALYAIGTLAAYWSLERLALIIGWPT